MKSCLFFALMLVAVVSISGCHEMIVVHTSRPVIYAPPPPPTPCFVRAPVVVHYPSPVIVHHAPVVVHRPPVVIHRPPVVIHRYHPVGGYHGPYHRGR
jgi:hypothetical protein